nr:hypothetical protein [Tanacetum cinerariifolium]
IEGGLDLVNSDIRLTMLNLELAGSWLRPLFPTLLIPSEIRSISEWMLPTLCPSLQLFFCSNRCDESSPTQGGDTGLKRAVEASLRNRMRDERQTRIEIER